MAEEKPEADPVQSLIAKILDAEARGESVSREEIIRSHPEYGKPLREFFANLDLMNSPGSRKESKLPVDDADSNQIDAYPEELVGKAATLPPTLARAEIPDIPKSGQKHAGGRELEERIHYFGDYQLLEEIARGGMGVVYKAKQVSLNRIVAVKMILAGQLAGQEDIQRFRTEAEAAASLDHVGIVPIYEVGQHQGQHFFSMGFVDGPSLADILQDGPMDHQRTATLLFEICKALAVAHEQGVIHRDLKPANILLDQNGQPKITDFGLAKNLSSESGLTGTGQLLGTPSYMSPEQASGAIDEVGTRSDVYALGALLYNMLTGRPPFQSASLMETLQQVRETEPVSPRKLNPTIPVDLETICLKCLSKRSTDRYASVSTLETEVGRYLEGRPIVARPIGATERAWRWCVRNPAIASLSATALAILIIGATVSVGFAFIAWQEADKARSAQSEAESNAELFAQEKIRAEQLAAEALKNEAEALSAKGEAERQAGVATALRLVSLAKEQKDSSTSIALKLSIEAVEATRRLGEEPVEGAHEILEQSADAFSGSRLSEDIERNLEFSGDGRWLFTVKQQNSLTGDWNVRVRDWSSDDHPVIDVLRHDSNVHAIATSTENQLAVGCSDGTVWLWGISDESKWSLLQVLQSPNEVKSGSGVQYVEFSPNGRWLVANYSNQSRLWDLSQPLAEMSSITLSGGGRQDLFSANGKWLTVYSTDTRSLSILNLEEARPLETLREFSSGSASGGRLVSHDGRWLVCHDSYRSGIGRTDAQVFDLSDLTDLDPKIEIAREHVGAVKMSPDGRWLLLNQSDQIDSAKWQTRVWDLTQTTPLETVTSIEELAERVLRAEFNSTGSRLITYSADSSTRTENLQTLDLRSMSVEYLADMSTHFQGTRPSMTLCPEDRWLCLNGRGKTRLVNLDDPHDIFPLQGSERFGDRCLFSKDSRHLVSHSSFSRTQFWNLNVPDPSSSNVIMRHGQGIKEIAHSKDGRWLAAAANEGVQLMDLSASDSVVEVLGLSKTVERLVISPDSTLLACGCSDGTIMLWDLTNTEMNSPAQTLVGHSGPVAALEFSPDGRWLVSGASDRTARLWDLNSDDINSSGIVLHSTQFSNFSRPETIDNAAFSADSRWLATSGDELTIWVWDLHLENPSVRPIVLMNEDPSISGVIMMSKSRVSQGSQWMAFGPKGRWLATGGRGGANLWDFDAGINEIPAEPPGASSFAVVRPSLTPHILERKGYEATQVSFSPDGKHLVTQGREINIWDLQSELDEPLQTIREMGGTRLAFTSNGTRFLSYGTRGILVCEFSATGIKSTWLSKNNATINCLSVAADSQFVFTGDQQGNVKLRELVIEILLDRSRSIAREGLSIDQREKFQLALSEEQLAEQERLQAVDFKKDIWKAYGEATRIRYKKDAARPHFERTLKLISQLAPDFRNLDISYLIPKRPNPFNSFDLAAVSIAKSIRDVEERGIEGTAHFELENYAEAVEAFRACNRLREETTPSLENSYRWIMLAKALFETGDLDGARRIAEQLRELIRLELIRHDVPAPKVWSTLVDLWNTLEQDSRQSSSLPDLESQIRESNGLINETGALVLDATSESFETIRIALEAQSYSLRCILPRTQDGVLLFSAAWDRSGLESRFAVDIDERTFEVNQEKNTAEGFQLVDLGGISTDETQEKYFAFWTKTRADSRSPNTSLVYENGLSLAELLKFADRLQSTHLPVSLRQYRVGDQTRFCAVWKAGHVGDEAAVISRYASNNLNLAGRQTPSEPKNVSVATDPKSVDVFRFLAELLLASGFAPKSLGVNVNNANMRVAAVWENPTKQVTPAAEDAWSTEWEVLSDFRNLYSTKTKGGEYPLEIQGKAVRGEHLYRARFRVCPKDTQWLARYGFYEAAYPSWKQRFEEQGYKLLTKNNFTDINGLNRYCATWIKVLPEYKRPAIELHASDATEIVNGLQLKLGRIAEQSSDSANITDDDLMLAELAVELYPKAPAYEALANVQRELGNYSASFEALWTSFTKTNATTPVLVERDFRIKLAGFIDHVAETLATSEDVNAEISSFLNAPLRAFLSETRATSFNPSDVRAVNKLVWENVLHTSSSAGFSLHVPALGPVSKQLMTARPRSNLELMETLVKQNSNRAYVNTLGVAYYRAERYEVAIETLKKSISLAKGAGFSLDAFVIAMSEHKLGNMEEAESWYQRACEWMEENAPDDKELASFRSEAEALLKANSSKPSPQP